MEYIKEISKLLGISETEYLQENLDSYRELASNIEHKLQITEELINFYENIEFRNSDKKKTAEELDMISSNRSFCEDIRNKYFYLDLDSYDEKLYAKYIIQRNLLLGFLQYFEDV